MRAYKSLVEKAISLGYTVSVWDGEEWQVKKSIEPNEIYEAINSVDVAELRFRTTQGNLQASSNIVGWAQVSGGSEFEDDETVIDHNTYNEEIPNSVKYKWMDDWSVEYDKAQDSSFEPS